MPTVGATACLLTTPQSYAPVGHVQETGKQAAGLRPTRSPEADNLLEDILAKCLRGFLPHPLLKHRGLLLKLLWGWGVKEEGLGRPQKLIKCRQPINRSLSRALEGSKASPFLHDLSFL